MALLLITAIIILGSCDNVIYEHQGNGLNQFQENPVVITWNGQNTTDVQSFQANVQVYSKNSRKGNVAGLTREYRLAIRSAGDQIVTRIDLKQDESVPYRSIITDGEEAVLFNPITEEIGYRIPLEDSKSPLNRIFAGQSGLSRINLALIREEAKRLSLDITEDTTSNTLLLELPPNLIPQNGLDMITRSRAAFNLANETLLETEVVMIRDDGTIVTTTATPIYEDDNGVPVKLVTVRAV